MARLRKPIEREPAEGLLGRVARPVAKPAPVAPKPVVEPPPAVVAPAPAPVASQDKLMEELKALGYNPDAPQNPYDQGVEADSEYGSRSYWGVVGPSSMTGDVYGALKAGGVTSLADLQVVSGPPGAYGMATKSYVNRRTGQPVDVVDDMVINVSGNGTGRKGNVQTYLNLKPQSDGSVKTSTFQTTLGGSGLGDLVKSVARPALAVAAILPTPIQPYAQLANAALAAKDGKPLNAALSLAGAANSFGAFDGLGSVPAGGSVPDAPGGLNSVSGYNPNGFGGLPKPIIGSELAGGASMIPGIDTNAFTGGLNTVAAGSGLTSLGGPPDMTPVGKPGLLEVPALPEVAPPQSLLETPPMVEPIVEPTIPKPVSNDPFKDVSGYNPDGFGGTPKPIIASEAPGLSQIPGMNPDAFAPGYGGLLPGNGVTSPGAPMDQNLYQQAVAKGKELLAAGKDNEFYQWMTDPANALYVKAAMAGGGALLSSVGSSSSGGSSYKDDGYRPTISRGGFQASIPATGAAPGGPGMAPGGFGSGISLPTTGQANDGLWRYAGNRPASLISPPYTAPQTGLISPPAVANYNPRPTGALPTNVPPMQYGYDDPVPLNRTQLSPEMQRAMSPFLGLLNTSPTRGFF